MSELLVRVKDRQLAEPRNAHLVCQTGDVVTVREDGSYWSPRELSNPAWRIIKCPSMPINEARLLVAPPLDGSRRRASKLDLAQFPRTFVDDDARVEQTKVIDVTTIRIAKVAYEVKEEIVIG